MENKGFMLVELVVVTGIIVLLLSLALPNYRYSNQRLALDRSAHKLAQDFRRTQEMAMSGQTFTDKNGGNFPAGGYGIRLQGAAAPESYILFGDVDGNHEYEPATDFETETVLMEKGVVINDIQTSEGGTINLFVTFLPPNPIIFFEPTSLATWIRIDLIHENDPTQIKSVLVNKVGLVSIE